MSDRQKTVISVVANTEDGNEDNYYSLADLWSLLDNHSNNHRFHDVKEDVANDDEEFIRVSTSDPLSFSELFPWQGNPNHASLLSVNASPSPNHRKFDSYRNSNHIVDEKNSNDLNSILIGSLEKRNNYSENDWSTISEQQQQQQLVQDNPSFNYLLSPYRPNHLPLTLHETPQLRGNSTNSTTVPEIWNEDEENSVVSNIQRNIAKHDYIRQREIHERDIMKDSFDRERRALNQRIDELDRYLKRKDMLLEELNSDLEREKGLSKSKLDESSVILDSKMLLLENQQQENVTLKKELAHYRNLFEEELNKSEHFQSMLNEIRKEFGSCQADLNNTKHLLMLSSEKSTQLEARLKANQIETKDVIEEMTDKIQHDQENKCILESQIEDMKKALCRGKLLEEELEQLRRKDVKSQAAIEDKTSQLNDIRMEHSKIASMLEEKTLVLSETSSRLDTVLHDNKAMKLELNKLQNEVKTLSENAQNFSSTKNEMQKIEDELRKDLMESTKLVQSLYTEIETYKVESEEKVTKLTYELNDKNTLFDEHKKDYLKLVHEKKHFKDEYHIVKSECQKLEDDMENLRGALHQAEETIQSVVEPLRTENEELKSHISFLQDELGKLRVNSIPTVNEGNEPKIVLQDDVISLRNEIETINTEKCALKNELDGAWKNLNKMSDELQAGAKSKVDMQRIIDDISSKNEKLTKTIAVLEDSIHVNECASKENLRNRAELEAELNKTESELERLEVTQEQRVNEKLEKEGFTTDSLRSDLKKKEQDLAELIHLSAEKEMEISALGESLRGFQLMYTELKLSKEKETFELQNCCDSYKEQIEKLQSDSDTKILEANEAMLELASEIESLNDIIIQKNDELNHKNILLNDSILANSKLGDNLSSLRNQLRNVEVINNSLEQELKTNENLHLENGKLQVRCAELESENKEYGKKLKAIELVYQEGNIVNTAEVGSLNHNLISKGEDSIQHQSFSASTEHQFSNLTNKSPNSKKKLAESVDEKTLLTNQLVIKQRGIESFQGEHTLNTCGEASDNLRGSAKEFLDCSTLVPINSGNEIQQEYEYLNLLLREKISIIQQLEESNKRIIDEKAKVEIGLKNEQEMYKVRIQSLNDEHIEAIQAVNERLVHLTSELETVTNDLHLKDELITGLNDQITKLSTSENDNSNWKRMDESITDCLADIVALEGSLKVASEENARLHHASKQQLLKISSLETSLIHKDEETKALVSELASELDRINTELDATNASMNTLRESLSAEQRKCQSMECSLKRSKLLNSTLSDENNVLNENILKLTSKLSDESDALEKMKKTINYGSTEKQLLTDEIESLSLRLKSAVEERDILASKHDNEINEIRLNTKKEVDSYHELSLEFEKYRQERRNTDAREASLRDEILNLRSDLRSEQWQAEQSNERVRELRKELNCTQENLLETRDQLAKSEHLLSKVKLKFDKELETLKNNLATKEELYKKIVQEYEKLDSETKQARENSINVERAQNLKIQQLQTSFSNKVAELERTLCLLSESREENDKLKLAVADIEGPDKIDTHVLENELHTARDELTKAQSTISKNEAHIANLTDQLDEAHKLYKERIDEMNCTLFTSENDLSEGRRVISQNEDDILRMKVSLKSANDENMKLQDQISLYLSKMKSNESEARAVISELTRELETIRRECDGLSKLREGDCFSSDATINKECNVEKPEVLINFNRYEEKELERLRAYIVEFHLNQEQLQMEADQLNSSVRRQSTEKIKSLNSEIELLRSDLEAEASQTKRYFSCLENAQIEADKLNQAVRKNFSDKIYSLKKEIALLQADKEKLLSVIDEYHDAGSQNLTTEESVLRNQVKDLHCKYVFQKERADSCATAKRQLEEQMGAVESRVLNLWKKYSKQNKKSQSTQTDAEKPRELNSPRTSSLQMELKQIDNTILQEDPTAECRRDEKIPMK